jgi:hypothetical protein
MKINQVFLIVSATLNIWLSTISGFAQSPVWTATSGTIPDLTGKSYTNAGSDIINADSDNNILIGAQYGTNDFVKVDINSDDNPVARATYVTGSPENFISGNNVNLGGDRVLDADRTVQTLRFDGGHTLDLGGHTLTLESGGLMLNGPATISNGAIITGSGRNLWVGGGNGLTVSAAITGSGGLDFQTNNTLTLSGENTFTGDVWLRSPTLNLNSTTALGTGTSMVHLINNGAEHTINFGTDITITRDITDSGGTTVLNTSGHTVELAGDWSHNTATGVSGQGQGNLGIKGAGTLIFSGYSVARWGSTELYGGEWRITGTHASSGGDYGMNIRVYGSDNTTLTISGNGWLKSEVGETKFQENAGTDLTVNITENGKLSTNQLTINSRTTLNQRGGLVASGNTFMAAQTTYTLTGGTLSPRGEFRLGTNSKLKLDGGVIATSTADISIVANTSTAYGSVLVGAGGANFDVGAGRTVEVKNINMLHDAAVSGRDGGIVKTGGGLLRIISFADHVTGTHTFSGNIMVHSGTFQLGTAENNPSVGTTQWTFALDAAGDINKIITAAGATTLMWGKINLDLADFSASGSENKTWDLLDGAGTYSFNNRFALVGAGTDWISIGDNQWKYSVTDNTWFTFDRASGVLSGFGVIPEPSTVFLLGAGAALLALTANIRKLK